MQGESLPQFLGEIVFSLTVFVKTFFQALGIVPAPCDQPLLYTLGTIDSRFHISEAEVLEATKRAEALWEDASGKNLFEYDQEKGLPVQFVYDERQEKTQAGQELEEKLGNMQIEKSEAEAKAKITQYNAANSEYEKKLAAYDRAAEEYNNRASKINKRGGATESEQKDLKEEYRALQEQFQELEQARQKVNNLAGTANQRITANQTLVETYNKEVTTFQEQYGGEGEFDQGVYTGQDITIYQYDDMPRLVMVLAHEMGHALGIEHVEDPGAIMYYLMREQDIGVIALNGADKQALQNICQKPKFFWSR